MACRTRQKVIISRNHKTILSRQMNIICETVYREARRPSHFLFGESVESLENISIL